MSTPETTPKTAAELKREREREARKALFTQGDQRPANTDLSTILGPEEGQQQAVPEPTAPAAPEAPAGTPEVGASPESDAAPAQADITPASASAEAVPAPAPTPKAAKPAKAVKQAPAKAPAPAPAPATQQPEPQPNAPAPWDNPQDPLPKGFTTKFDAATHAKMVWITDNVPKMSIQKIVHAAVADYVAKTLAERYKP